MVNRGLYSGERERHFVCLSGCLLKNMAECYRTYLMAAILIVLLTIIKENVVKSKIYISDHSVKKL